MGSPSQHRSIWQPISKASAFWGALSTSPGRTGAIAKGDAVVPGITGSQRPPGVGVQEAWPRLLPPHPPALPSSESLASCSGPNGSGEKEEGCLCLTDLRGARWSPDSGCLGVLVEAWLSRVPLLRGSAGSGFWGGFGLRVPCNEPREGT